MSQTHENDYLPCLSYQGYDRNPKGISYFYEENKFYFAYSDEFGQVILRSEGYTTELARENGINSVLNNLNEEHQYKIEQTENGKWVLILKAKNHQEIARSCPVATEVEAKLFLPSERAKMLEQKRKQMSKKETEDDYLICREYEEQIQQKNAIHPAFISFQHENGQHYFAWTNDTDEILLRSEGYSSEKARDNGIESVIKNLEIEERYKLEEHHGAHFAILRAGNNQEIARSCPQKTALDVKALLPSERNKKKNNNASTKIHDDDYLICREYDEMKMKKSNMFPDFISFQHDNGKFYFAWTDNTDQILLRSEAYTSGTARDNGIESVLRNLHLEDRYSIEEHHGAHFCILKAGNNQEIARSCPLKTALEARALLPSERAIAKSRNANKEDDYLIAREYQEQISKRSSLYPEFIRFQHKNGKYYFAWVNEQNQILLRSEAYVSESSRDNGIRSVLKNKNDRDLYHVEEHHGAYFLILKADNNQEIGRSVPFHSKEQAWNIISPNYITEEKSEELTSPTGVNQEFPKTVNHETGEVNQILDEKNQEKNKLNETAKTPIVTEIIQEKELVASNIEEKQIPNLVVPAPIIEQTEVDEISLNKVEVREQSVSKENKYNNDNTFTKTEYSSFDETKSESSFNWKWLLPLLLLPILFLWWKSCNKNAGEVSGNSTIIKNENITSQTQPTINANSDQTLTSGIINDSLTKNNTMEKANEIDNVENKKSVNEVSDCNLHWILFDYNSSNLSRSAQIEIDNLIALLNQHKDWSTKLTAHTDANGSDQYNQTLSLKRAKVVEDKLINAGINRLRIKAIAESENSPLAKNTDDDSGRKFNRRVEIYVLDKNNNPMCKSITPTIPMDLKK